MAAKSTEHRTYMRRYYVLIVLSLLAAHQNIAWATFSPIASEAKDDYGLTDAEITLLPAYSPMCFVLLTIPFSWMLQKFGLRFIGVSGAWILAIGCGIRCFIPYVPDASKWIWVMHVGHVLIGYTGLPVMILPPILSSVWFHPKERTLATSIAVTAEGIGSALAFVMNSLLTIQYSIRTMLYVQAEIALFVAILFTIYFPSRPPTPPSSSAEEDRTEFLKSLKLLLMKPSYIILVLSGGIITGLYFGFGSVLSVILNHSIGFNDKVIVTSVYEFFRSTSWMGAIASLVATVFGVVVGYFADRFQRKFKIILLLLLFSATITLIWFALSIYGWGWSNPINYFMTYLISNTLIVASLPVFYEAVVETTYPVSEGTSSGMLTLSLNVGTLIFAIIGIAGVFSDKYPERAKLMSWVTAGAGIVSFVLLLFYVERYERLTVDTKGNEKGAETLKEKSPLIINN